MNISTFGAFLLLATSCSNCVYAQTSVATACGPRASAVERFLTDSEKIRIQCINDYYEEQRAEQARIVAEVDAELTAQKEILQKSAYETDAMMFKISCDSPQGDRDPELVRKCRKELEIYKGLVAELDHLLGWKRQFETVPKGSAEEVQRKLEAPCPDEATLNKIQTVRYFKKKLYKIYERCVTLAP